MGPEASKPYATAFAGSEEMKRGSVFMMFRAEIGDLITQRSAEVHPRLTHSHVGFHGMAQAL